MPGIPHPAYASEARPIQPAGNFNSAQKRPALKPSPWLESRALMVIGTKRCENRTAEATAAIPVYWRWDAETPPLKKFVTRAPRGYPPCRGLELSYNRGPTAMGEQPWAARFRTLCGCDFNRSRIHPLILKQGPPAFRGFLQNSLRRKARNEP